MADHVRKVIPSQWWSSKCGLGPAAPLSDSFLEMHIGRPHLRPTESETGVGPSQLFQQALPVRVKPTLHSRNAALQEIQAAKKIDHWPSDQNLTIA